MQIIVPIRSCTVMKKKFVAGTLSLVFCFGNGSLLGRRKAGDSV